MTVKNSVIGAIAGLSLLLSVGQTTAQPQSQPKPLSTAECLTMMRVQVERAREINAGQREFDEHIAATNQAITQCFQRFIARYPSRDQRKRTKTLHAAFIIAFEKQGPRQMTVFQQALEDFVSVTRGE